MLSKASGIGEVDMLRSSSGPSGGVMNVRRADAIAMALVAMSLILVMFCPDESGTLKQVCLVGAIVLPFLAVAVSVIARAK